MSLFPIAPAPWRCHADVYWLMLTLRAPLVEDAYAPLEASSEFQTSTKYKGGLAAIQFIRYRDTPVGTYDEMIFTPGAFEVPPSSDGQKRPDNLRITRIYVSQKDTTWNGRKNWGIPKHLARFEFQDLSRPDRVQIRIFAPGPAVKTPFFTLNVQAFTWAPAFPFSTKWLEYLGQNTAMTQPPLPTGDKPELIGTSHWLRYASVISSSDVRLCWMTVEEADGKAGEDVEGWFPKVNPYKVGLLLKNAVIDIAEPETLDVALNTKM